VVCKKQPSLCKIIHFITPSFNNIMLCWTNFDWCSCNLEKRNLPQTVSRKQVTIFSCRLMRECSWITNNVLNFCSICWRNIACTICLHLGAQCVIISFIHDSPITCILWSHNVKIHPKKSSRDFHSKVILMNTFLELFDINNDIYSY